MEWCLHINGAEDLRGELRLERIPSLERSGLLQPAMRLTARLIADYFGEINFTRCAFGNEFCEHLAPSPAALGSALAAAHSDNLNFTLLTPYVSNQGIATYKPLFALLAERGGEVVFNDWGILNLLRREFPML